MAKFDIPKGEYLSTAYIMAGHSVITTRVGKTMAAPIRIYIDGQKYTDVPNTKAVKMIWKQIKAGTLPKIA